MADAVLTDNRAQLRKITSFPSLVGYLRDEMDWPIDGDDLEPITFDYTAEELGIEAASAAKILEIKRLRPLAVGQPWGIFFVRFEPKRLPVVALRRILSRVVLKKRASANSAERTAWEAEDLLFASNFGEGDDRQICFAHFTLDDQKTDLPTLKVLGWNDLDTSLRLDHVADTLTERLAWPDDERDSEAWREQWRSAFTLRHREVITTSKLLAERLAELARAIRNRINTVLSVETEDGPLTKLMEAFREALVHDLDADGFADMYAQTIAYGLLSARIADPKANTADDFAAHMRTNPFLKELMETFLHVGGRRKTGNGVGLDFDELGVSEVVALLDAANMDAVLRDFGDRKPEDDPVIHFYELFLKEYDARKRTQRGVFYTPLPVVSYIVRSVHELLRTEFGLRDGLADAATWGDMAEKHPGLTLPEGVKPTDRFVTVLDPATGTGTFLVQAIEVIHQTLVDRWKREGHSEKKRLDLWNEYVPKHLLPRLHGYELMMAPYAIAHVKIGLKLYETGYRFGSEDRARIYLTNALEPAHDFSGRFEFAIPALAHEAQAVNAVKQQGKFVVIIGNPPYSVTSANSGIFIDLLMNDYKKHVRGEQGIVALSDDYLKFIRLSQLLLDSSGCGICGLITNHGFLKGLIHRGVRKELISQFSALFIIDLHGDSNIGERVPIGKKNENVFDIQQGVSILIGSRIPSCSAERAVRHRELWGRRNEKYYALSSRSLLDSKWTDLHPAAPSFFLIPFDDANMEEYRTFASIQDLMPINSCGVKTHRDGIIIDYQKDHLIGRISDIASEPDLEALRGRYDIADTPHWKLKEAQAKIKAKDIRQLIRRITYRPFDDRWIYYNPAIIEKGDAKYPTLKHMLGGNIALICARIQATGRFDAVFVSRQLVEMKTAESSRSCTVFPLFLADGVQPPQTELHAGRRRPNFDARALRLIVETLGIERKGDFGLPEGIKPEDILHYAYAVMHSPGYRTRYAEFLTIEFPRLPPCSSSELFRELARLGRELVALHLVEEPVQQNFSVRYNKAEQAWRPEVAKGQSLPVALAFNGPEGPVVGKVGWSEDTVWIDAVKPRKGAADCKVTGTVGFRGVPEEVWNFHIGGYQVCEKWLKDRKGRTLAAEDITHYYRIVIGLYETIRIMREIDEVIDAHGGWPDAFQSKTGKESALSEVTETALEQRELVSAPARTRS